MNFVKVAKLGAAVVEVALETGATAAQALAAAEMTAEGFVLRINGAPAEPEAPVRGGDVITLVPKIKGGAH